MDDEEEEELVYDPCKNVLKTSTLMSNQLKLPVLSALCTLASSGDGEGKSCLAQNLHPSPDFHHLGPLIWQCRHQLWHRGLCIILWRTSKAFSPAQWEAAPGLSLSQALRPLPLCRGGVLFSCKGECNGCSSRFPFDTSYWASGQYCKTVACCYFSR